MIAQVEPIFDGYVRRLFEPKPHIAAALLAHERKAVCVERVCDQIRRAETSCNIGRKMNVERFRIMIEAAAKMFCENALRHLEERALSQAERTRREDEARQEKQLEAEFDEMQAEATSGKLVSHPGAVAR